MKTEYAPDNTRAAIVVLFSVAVAVTVIALLIGLSEKPDVTSIAITPGQSEGAPAAAVPTTGESFGFDFDDAADAVSGESGDEAAAAGADVSEATAAGDSPADAELPTVVVPTSEPTPTPDIAAAVEPTAIAETDTDASDDPLDSVGVPGLPTTSGSVQGTFFTRPDEDEGAVVTQNLIEVSFAEDGSGAFQGVLDITYLDGTHILLNMSGPLEWTATTPQVKANLTGAYTFDAPIDADDVTSDDAELSISSLETGSGSLCTPKCFGFTFPPQTGF